MLGVGSLFQPPKKREPLGRFSKPVLAARSVIRNGTGRGRDCWSLCRSSALGTQEMTVNLNFVRPPRHTRRGNLLPAAGEQEDFLLIFTGCRCHVPFVRAWVSLANTRRWSSLLACCSPEGLAAAKRSAQFGCRSHLHGRGVDSGTREPIAVGDYPPRLGPAGRPMVMDLIRLPVRASVLYLFIESRVLLAGSFRGVRFQFLFMGLRGTSQGTGLRHCRVVREPLWRSVQPVRLRLRRVRSASQGVLFVCRLILM